MGEEKTLYESESSRTLSEVISFLQQLAQWLGDGRIAFDDGQETVVITIPNDVTLEIEIEEEAEGDNQVKRSLEIEIEWIEEKTRSATYPSKTEKGSDRNVASGFADEEE